MKDQEIDPIELMYKSKKDKANSSKETMDNSEKDKEIFSKNQCIRVRKR